MGGLYTNLYSLTIEDLEAPSILQYSKKSDSKWYQTLAYEVTILLQEFHRYCLFFLLCTNFQSSLISNKQLN